MTAYTDYLDSKAWKEKRTKVRWRARGWCERCKVGPRADVHHLTYERVGHERLSDLVGVCRECHEYLHGLRNKDPADERYSGPEVAMAREVARYIQLGMADFARLVYLSRPEYGRILEKRLQSVGHALLPNGGSFGGEV